MSDEPDVPCGAATLAKPRPDASAPLPSTAAMPIGKAGAPPRRDDAAPADIAPEDWDLLFGVALEVLARVAQEAAAAEDQAAGLRLLSPPLRECIDILDHLRRSAPRLHGPGDAQPGPRLP